MVHRLRSFGGPPTSVLWGTTDFGTSEHHLLRSFGGPLTSVLWGTTEFGPLGDHQLRSLVAPLTLILRGTMDIGPSGDHGHRSFGDRQLQSFGGPPTSVFRGTTHFGPLGDRLRSVALRCFGEPTSITRNSVAPTTLVNLNITSVLWTSARCLKVFFFLRVYPTGTLLCLS